MAIQRFKKTNYVDHTDINLKEENEILKEKTLLLESVINNYIHDFDVEKAEWEKKEELKIENLMDNFEKNRELEKRDNIKFIIVSAIIFIFSLSLSALLFNVESVALWILALILMGFSAFSFIFFVENVVDLLTIIKEKRKEILIFVEDKSYYNKVWYKKIFISRLKEVNRVSFGLSNIDFPNENLKKFWMKKIYKERKGDLSIELNKNTENKYEVKREIVEEKLRSFLKI